MATFQHYAERQRRMSGPMSPSTRRPLSESPRERTMSLYETHFINGFDLGYPL
ncbi:hypothetical protein HDU97_010352 [Phlyctochytrium planicorne]|nr:hypothetical protein HDU97_010352 [Phlyctochytrium planicorne]